MQQTKYFNDDIMTSSLSMRKKK